MWIASKQGWFSIVKHRDMPDTFMVRARVKGDLENLRELIPLTQNVVSTPAADYPFRLIVSGSEVLETLAKLGEGIGYSNFKSEVGKLPGQKAKLHAYHEVWASMRRVEEPGARQASVSPLVNQAPEEE